MTDTQTRAGYSGPHGRQDRNRERHERALDVTGGGRA